MLTINAGGGLSLPHASKQAGAHHHPSNGPTLAPAPSTRTTRKAACLPAAHTEGRGAVDGVRVSAAAGHKQHGQDTSALERAAPPVGRVQHLVSHYECLSSQGSTPSGSPRRDVSRSVDAVLAAEPCTEQPAPSKRALAMAASLSSAKDTSSSGGSRGSSVAARAGREGSNGAGSDHSSNGSRAGVTMDRGAGARNSAEQQQQQQQQSNGPSSPVGKRAVLTHLCVLDGLNHAYYERQSERSVQPRMPATPEGLQAADWVSQVLGYQMDGQALGGWEARVVDGAIRAGLPPETIRSTDLMELYRALQLNPEAPSPPPPPQPQPPQQSGPNPTTRAPDPDVTTTPSYPFAMVTAYGDVIPEESGLLTQQLVMTMLALTSHVGGPVVQGGLSPRALQQTVAHLGEAVLALGRFFVTATVTAQSRLPRLPPPTSKYSPYPSPPPTPTFSAATPTRSDPLRALLAGQRFGHFKTPIQPSKYVPRMGSFAEHVAAAGAAAASASRAGADAVRALLAGQPMGHFKTPLQPSKFTPRPDFTAPQAAADGAAVDSRDAMRALLAGQSLGHFKQPLAPSKFAPRPDFTAPQAAADATAVKSRDAMRALLAGQPLGHFKQPLAPSKYTPRPDFTAPQAAGEDNSVADSRDAMRALLAGQPIGHFKQPLAPSKYAPRPAADTLVPADAGTDSTAAHSRDAIRALLAGEPLGHFKQPMAGARKYAPALPTQWGWADGDEAAGEEEDDELDVMLPMPPPSTAQRATPAAQQQDARASAGAGAGVATPPSLTTLEPAAAATAAYLLSDGPAGSSRGPHLWPFLSTPTQHEPRTPTRAPAPPAAAAAPAAPTKPAAPKVPPNVADVRAWIARFRAHQAESTPPVSHPLPDAAAAEAATPLSKPSVDVFGAGARADSATDMHNQPAAAAARCAAMLAAQAYEGAAATAAAAARTTDVNAALAYAADASTLAAAASADAGVAVEKAQEAARGSSGSPAAAAAAVLAAQHAASAAAAADAAARELQGAHALAAGGVTDGAAGGGAEGTGVAVSSDRLMAAARASAEQAREAAATAAAAAAAAAEAASGRVATPPLAPTAPAAAPQGAPVTSAEPDQAPSAAQQAAPETVSPPPLLEQQQQQQQQQQEQQPEHVRATRGKASSTRKYTGDWVRQALAGSLPSPPRVAAHKLAPALPTSFPAAATAGTAKTGVAKLLPGFASKQGTADAQQQQQETDASQQLSAGDTAAAATATAAAPAASMDRKYVPSMPTSWGAAAEHAKSGKRSSSSPARVLLDLLTKAGLLGGGSSTDRGTQPAPNTSSSGSSSSSSNSANGSSSSSTAAGSTVTSSSGAGSNGSGNSSSSSSSGGIATASPAPAGDSAPTGAFAGITSHVERRVKRMMQGVPLPRAGAANAAVQPEAAMSSHTQHDAAQRTAEALGAPDDPLEVTARELRQPDLVPAAASAFEILASKEMAPMRAKHEPIFLLLATALHSSSASQQPVWQCLHSRLAHARMGPACQEVPKFLADLQAFGDLRPLHRLLVQIEEEEQVIAVMASLTARYMRGILPPPDEEL